MNQYEKVRQRYKESIEAPGKIGISTLPSLSGKSLGFVSASQTTLLSQWNAALKFDELVISELQGMTHSRGGNCVSNLKINFTVFEGTNGPTIMIFAFGEAMQISSSDAISLSTNVRAGDSTKPESNEDPNELQTILKKLNAETAGENLKEFQGLIVDKKSSEIHSRAIELQAANGDLSYEVAVGRAHHELQK